jgi:hypothetical protein
MASASTLPDENTFENALNTQQRSSGVGIAYPSNYLIQRRIPTRTPAEERVYLGLEAGGKRHAETMRQIQSEHKGLTYNYYLLRNAIALGTTKVVEYLAGPRVLAANR